MEERDCFRTQIQVEDIFVTSQSQTVSYCDNELLKTSSERIKDLIKSHRYSVVCSVFSAHIFSDKQK